MMQAAWQRWFAWHPVKLIFRLSIQDHNVKRPSWAKIDYESDYVLAYRWVWLKWLYRKQTPRSYGPNWKYFDGDLFDLMRENEHTV